MIECRLWLDYRGFQTQGFIYGPGVRKGVADTQLRSGNVQPQPIGRI